MDESLFQRAKGRKQPSFFGMMGKSIKIKRMETAEVAGYWDMLLIRMKDFENSL